SFIGFGNFATLFQDPLFWVTLYNTVFVTVISVPLYTLFALLLAVLADLPTRWQAVYRVAFFIPSQTPTVASALLWSWIYNPQYGIANAVLRFLHLPALNWLFDPNLAKPSLIIIGMWGVGATMVIFLAGLQGIPQEIYNAASVDGANLWHRFTAITLPLLSPVILFNIIIGIIGAFQSGFSIVYVWTSLGQGPDNSILLYVLYLYDNAFQYFKMGYASLLAWVLFLIVLLVTGVNFLVSKSWVYYEYGGAEK
ncbi:MAG TPA: sugar ABC transporter permease, partial [Chloroflexota bacterium]|nr:sugar ABC transporter permease [Chloroflexota bacterium]